MHVCSGMRLSLLYDGKNGVWLLYRMGWVAFGGLCVCRGRTAGRIGRLIRLLTLAAVGNR